MRIIAGKARSRTIEAPEGRDTRPTLDRVRENLFNMLQRRTAGSRVLDLFAGSGALSFEALSRGAEFAVLVDRDRKANQAEQRNAASLGFESQCRILFREWERAVAQLIEEKESFDLVFLDPPYAMQNMTTVMQAIIPLLAEDALIILEHEGKIEPLTPEEYTRTDSRKWGYCGVSFYRYAPKENEGT